MERIILSKFVLNLAGYCNILLNRSFAAEIVGRMQERQLFYVVLQLALKFRNAPDDIQVFNEMFVICMYTVLSPLRFQGPECAISIFSEYILCAKSRF